MRCRRRMDGEAAHVADIGDMIEQLQAVDELATRFGAAFQLEAEQAAEAALEIGLRPSPLLAVRQARIADVLHRRELVPVLIQRHCTPAVCAQPPRTLYNA